MANDKLAKPQTFGILSAAPDELAAMQELVAEAVQDDVTQFDLPEIKVPAGGGTSWEVPTLEGDQAHAAEIEWRRAMHRKLLHVIDLRRKDVRQFSEAQLRHEAWLDVASNR